MADLRMSQVQTLRRNGNGNHGEVDPLAQSINDQRRVLAAKSYERMSEDMDSSALEARNKKLTLEIEREELIAKTRGGTKQNDVWQEYLLDQLKTVQSQLADTQRALSEQQLNVLTDRMEMLAGELARVQQQPQPDQGRAPSLREQIQESLDTYALLRPETPEPQVQQPATNLLEIKRLDAQLKGWELRTQIEADQRKRDEERQHAIRLAELELERDKINKQLDIERDHKERMDRFYTDTAPKIIDVITPILSQMSAMWANGAAAAAAAGPVVMPQVASVITIPPGFQSSACDKCGNIMIYNPSWGEAFCNQCGAHYKDDGSSDLSSQPEEQNSHSNQSGIG